MISTTSAILYRGWPKLFSACPGAARKGAILALMSLSGPASASFRSNRDSRLSTIRARERLAWESPEKFLA
jgi:hypothetical protein